MPGQKNLRTFNSDHLKFKYPKGLKNKNRNIKKYIDKKTNVSNIDWNKVAGSGPGIPEENVTNPRNGFLYVDETTGEAYIFMKKLGWVDMSSWQPNVGEGMPDSENPPNPITGDQYMDVLTGDFYLFSEGIGWVLSSGIEGPQGPPGESFTFNLMTKMGSDGPVLSGPIKVEHGQTVQLWIDNGNLYADVI